MGNKGQSTTSQTQTNTPAGAGQVQGALSQAQSAAQLPFNIPQAPVAGFSPDQLAAFQTVNNSQGMAQPYINQANQYFQQSAQGPNVNQFLNPYAGAVTAQMNNIFGQQQSQNTGQLTQAAGGVGADRIAVGQGNLANQQGLAAGQTLASLYAPSLSAATQEQSLLQGAGYGTAALGSQAQNAALTGAQAQLGTGGLQQQLSQAQLNAPYQQQLAQSAFPYQQAQFLASITGALAPGLGGTTSGYGTSNPAQPSIWSQLLGAGVAGAGLYNGLGGSTSGANPFGSSPSYGGGNAFSGDAYGGSASNPLPGLSASDYGARGGVMGKDGGGAVGPYNLPSGFNDRPINVASQPIIPSEQLHPIQAQTPQLNLTPPAASSSGGVGDAVKTAAQMALMFANRGGRTPYDVGGSVDDQIDPPNNMGFAGGGDVGAAPLKERFAAASNAVADGSFDPVGANYTPYNYVPLKAAARQTQRRAFADGGTPGEGQPIQPYSITPQIRTRMERRLQNAEGDDQLQRVIKDAARYGVDWSEHGGAAGGRAFAEGGDTDAASAWNPDEPFRMPGQAAMDAWRGDTPLPFAGADEAPAAKATPLAARRAARAAPADSPTDVSASAKTSGEAPGGPGDPSTAPSSGDVTSDFAKSPWAALTSAGLGMMAGTSPYAGVNIGQGGLQGLKTLETQRTDTQKDTTIAQAAKRLAQEAKFHEDSFNRETVSEKNARIQASRPYDQLTAYQQSQVDRQEEQDKLARDRFDRPYSELTKAEQATLEQSRLQHEQTILGQGMRWNADHSAQEPVPGGIHDPATIRSEADAKRLPAMSREDMAPLVEAYMAGDRSVTANIGRGTQGPANIQQMWGMISERLHNQGADGNMLAAAKANFMAQSAGARVAAQRESNIETAVNEAKGTFPEVLRTSKLLPRTDYPLVNSALEMWRTNTGSKEQRQYGAAIQAAITAYSQAMSRTGTNSVYAQQHAQEVLSHVDGPDALESTIQQLNTEMAIAQHAPEETRQSILNRILGIKEGTAPPPAATTTAPATAGPVKVATPADVSKLPKGTPFVTPDGRTGTAP